MRLRVFEKKRDFIRYTLPLYIVAVGEAGGTGIETVHLIVGGNVDQTIWGRFDFIDAPWVEAVAFYGRDAVVVFVQNISSAQSAEPDFSGKVFCDTSDVVVFNYVRCLEVGAEDLNVVTIVAA